MLTRREMLRAGYSSKDPQFKEGEGMLRTGYESKGSSMKKSAV